MNTIVQQWLHEISVTKSLNTYRNYEQCINDFFSTYSELTPANLLDQIEAWKKDELDNNTIVLKLTIIRQLATYMAFKGEDTYEILKITKSIKLKDKIQEFATEKQAKETIAALSKLSHKVIVALMFYGGLRVSEAIALHMDDLRENGFIVRDPKNNSDRFVPYLSKVLTNVLDEYIQSTRPTGLLFPDVIQNSFQKTLKRTLEYIGYPKLHAHSFRHGFITKALEKNIDVATIASLSGHKNMQNIQKYAHVTQAMLEKTKDIFKKE